MDIGVKEIDIWHLDRGFASCGYHYVIRKDGTIEEGRPEKTPGAHCKGHNYDSIGVCYVGGWKGDDDRTAEQMKSMHELCKKLYDKYGGLEFYSHSDFSNKSCPNFNAKEELSYIKEL
jgi:N-acetylmuramoyl-L-alanine amidase